MSSPEPGKSAKRRASDYAESRNWNAGITKSSSRQHSEYVEHRSSSVSSRTTSSSSGSTSSSDTDSTDITDTGEDVKVATTGWKFSGETKTYQAYHPDQWETPKEVYFSEFVITESDLRVKTCEFTSPQDIDLTKGRVCIWIQRKYGENFGGVVLSKEVDKETGLYTYVCQDWNRLLQSKVYVILAGDMQIYDILKILLVKMGLSTDGLQPIEYYDYSMMDIPYDDDPLESLNKNNAEINTDSSNTVISVTEVSTAGSQTNEDTSEDSEDSDSTTTTTTSETKKEVTNAQPKKTLKEIKYNLMKLTLEGLYDKVSALDFIRTLVHRQGSLIEFYMDENGVPRFEKYQQDTWLKKRWIFVDTDVYDTKLKMDLTDMITQVAIKRIDSLNPNATLYTSEKVLNVNIAKYFGVMGDVVDNPVRPTSGDTGASYSGDVITATGKPSCGHCGGKAPYVNVTRSYVNKCPFCGKTNLKDTPKDPSRTRIPEGEITCGSGKAPYNDGCDADFCINCGHEKMTRDAAQLTPVGASWDGGNTTGLSSSSRRTSGTSSSSSSSSSGDDSTDDTATEDATGTVVQTEDPAKNYQVARIQMSQSVRKLLTFRIKLPGEYPNLHTNQFCNIMTSDTFLMENIPEIGKKLNGKFTRYAGYERNRYYIEEVLTTCSQTQGVYTELELNPFASDYSNFARMQIQAEQALASALGGDGGSVGNANGQDCTSDHFRTNHICIGYGGSATSQTPTAKALAVIGNSSANYAQVAKQAGGNPAKALKILHARYHWENYQDNHGTDRCPREMYKAFLAGSMGSNCGDASWLMKCVFDCMGLQNYILHGSPCGDGHYWNCVKYQGRWIMGDLCYWGKSHNQLSRM